MGKYKIVVYAISKNEEKFVDRFVDSAQEADEIYVLDTGSTDNTVKKLKARGVKVHKKIIKPWRFDIARNLSLELIPSDTDICICLDLDEVLEKGWRSKLEKIWDKDTNRLSYNYNWSLDEDNKPLVNFNISKIHDRIHYKWTHPVHEVLTYVGKNEKIIETNEITVNHYPDREKSRSSYLPLLELSVKEDPLDDRNYHYLGREYMYYKKWDKCIDTLIHHLNMETANWKDERCASMRFIARSYQHLNRYEEAKMWLEKAINEAPYLREPYVEMAMLEYNLKNYKELEYYCDRALEIKNKRKTYINEQFAWDSTIYDLLSIASYYLNKKEKALLNVNKALEISPNDERLKKNKELYKKM